MKPWLTMLMGIFVLAGIGCRQDSLLDKMAAITVERAVFTVQIPARGELRAVKSTRLKGASNVNGPQILAWMVPENSWVKQGDLVIRMDPTWFNEQIRSETANVSRLDLEIRQKQQQLAKEKSDISQQVELTDIERQQADLYAARDESIYSRQKIIEDSINLEYLTTKRDHYKTVLARLERKSRTEMQLLELKRKTCEVKLQQLKQSLMALEIRAPHDGLLIYTKNWRGDKPQLGMTVWSGYELAELPDLQVMEAVVQVHEAESAGLAINLPVSILPEAFPGMVLQGRVTAVAQVANPIENDSPLKYFEVKVELPVNRSAELKPGSQVNGLIEAKRIDDVIAIPHQALISEEGKIWVLVRHGSQMEKRQVETGERSVTRTVISKGLQAGEEILLGNPAIANGRGH